MSHPALKQIAAAIQRLPREHRGCCSASLDGIDGSGVVLQCTSDVTDSAFRRIAEMVGGLPEVTRLDLSRACMLTDSAMADVCSFVSLRELEVNGSALTDEGLESLSTLSDQLVDLSVKVGIHLTDRCLASVGRFTKLHSLKLQDAGITGDGLRELAPLTKLKWLTLDGCSAVDDAGLRHLHGLPLCYVNLSNTEAARRTVWKRLTGRTRELKELTRIVRYSARFETGGGSVLAACTRPRPVPEAPIARVPLPPAVADSGTTDRPKGASVVTPETPVYCPQVSCAFLPPCPSDRDQPYVKQQMTRLPKLFPLPSRRSPALDEEAYYYACPKCGFTLQARDAREHLSSEGVIRRGLPAPKPLVGEPSAPLAQPAPAAAASADPPADFRGIGLVILLFVGIFGWAIYRHSAHEGGAPVRSDSPVQPGSGATPDGIGRPPAGGQNQPDVRLSCAGCGGDGKCSICFGAKRRSCGACSGSGRNVMEGTRCSSCRGEGYIECSACGGSGRCAGCGGTGKGR